jgi:hypothetical protein
MRYVRQLLFPMMLGLVVTVPASAGAVRTRDICIASPTGGGSFNTFVFRDVEPLSRGRAVTLKGLFFTGAQKVEPVSGSAAMTSDGTIVLGAFVHSTAQSINDFTVAGITDANFVGILNYDNDGDFKPNGTLAMEPRDCATLAIP